MAFALEAVALGRTLPSTWEGRHVADQLFRSATSIAANYRASCRARSYREFVAKLGLVLEESDETLFWLELIEQTSLGSGPKLTALTKEAHELVAIFTASCRTANQNRQAAG